jgi:flagellar hook-basal body protein
VKEILLVIARTAESVGDRDQRCAQQLNEVTANLNSIASLGEISQIRVSIEKSATDVNGSVDRMAAEGKAVLDRLQMQVATFETKLAEAEQIASCDALTRLRSRLWPHRQCQRPEHDLEPDGLGRKAYHNSGDLRIDLDPGHSFRRLRTTQNGYASGQYSDFAIGSDVTVTFSNQQKLNVGQIALGNVTNPQGLRDMGNDDYSTTLAIGNVVITTSGSAGLGTMQNGALEGSNVNISGEFSALIIAQPAFEANSKTITPSTLSPRKP